MTAGASRASAPRAAATAEWLGESGAEADILVRRLGMIGACTRDYAALGQDARTMLDPYMALRRAITALVAARGGLANVGKHPWAAVPPGILPMNQLWWAVPALLRRNDTRLLNGWTWQQVLTEALRQAASEPRAWGEVHRPHFIHPLSALYPQAAALLNPPSLPIGGDTDTVQANGISAATGLEATYGAIARYVFDVGNWDACRWAVFHGTSGHPGSPHYADQNPVWSRCEMVPMLYDWTIIVAEAEATQKLCP